MMAKRKLKTWVKSTLIGGAVSVGILGFSSMTFSNSDWVNENITRSSQLMSEAGYNKKEELKTIPKDTNINANLDPFIQEQIELLEEELETYYNLKLEGYAENSVEIESTKKKIEQLRQTIVDRYKQDIDAMFSQQ